MLLVMVILFILRQVRKEGGFDGLEVDITFLIF